MPIAKRVVTLATSRLTVLADGPRPGNILCSQFRTTRLALGWYRCSVQQGNGYGRVGTTLHYTCGLASFRFPFDRASSSWRSCVPTNLFFVEFETAPDWICLPPTSSRLWKLRRILGLFSARSRQEATHPVPFVAATNWNAVARRNSEKGFLCVLGEI